jgi:hypothetical protein
MALRRPLRLLPLLLAVVLCGSGRIAGSLHAAEGLPARLADDEFWRLLTSLSERAGTFPSDNLLSNETALQQVIPDLTRQVAAGGVYLGVGPEQNFTYMAALRPRMAFIFDIRRGNLALHLIYKALFEMSADRVDFLARLFARQRPAGVASTATVAEILDALSKEESPESLYIENVRAVVNHLTKKHAFVLDAGDLLRLQHDYRAFHLYGPRIQYSSSRNEGPRGGEPTYSDLMVATDGAGAMRGYLATDESFQFLKRLETDNLVVPLVGNFSGPKAIRAVGAYLRENGATVSVFYVSNVEEYLRQDGVWTNFCTNVASLPIDDSSIFIRSVRGRTSSGLFTLHSSLEPIGATIRDCQ